MKHNITEIATGILILLIGASLFAICYHLPKFIDKEVEQTPYNFNLCEEYGNQKELNFYMDSTHNVMMVKVGDSWYTEKELRFNCLGEDLK